MNEAGQSLPHSRVTSFLSFSKGKGDVCQHAEGCQPQEQVQEASIPCELLCSETCQALMVREEKKPADNRHSQQICNTKYEPGGHRQPSESNDEK